MLNEFKILGRTTKTIQMQENKNGKKFALVSIAIKQNDKEAKPKFVNLFANGKVAENLEKIVEKGSLCLFQGSVEVGKENQIFLVIDKFDLLSTPQKVKEKEKEKEVEEEEDDFPF